MLRYLAKGRRIYDPELDHRHRSDKADVARGKRSHDREHDWQPAGRPRGNWEFIAITNGRACPVLPEGPIAAFEQDVLWLFPPDSLHGWRSLNARPCHVHIFHFSALHPRVEDALPPSKRICIHLTAGDKRVIRRIYAELLPHYRQPDHTSLLRFEAAMIELCCLILSRDSMLATPTVFNADDEKVLQAQQYYREHMTENIGVTEVARAVYVSPGHLRRLFRSVRNESPRQAFCRIASEEACRLMSTTTLNLKEIAIRCGFGGQNEFSRFFTRTMGLSPSMWRANNSYRGYGLPTKR